MPRVLQHEAARASAVFFDLDRSGVDADVLRHLLAAAAGQNHVRGLRHLLHRHAPRAVVSRCARCNAGDLHS
jgi:hypothetical protein